MSNVVSSGAQVRTQSAEIADMNLEVVVIAVDDVDRAKQFYASLGWRIDADVQGGPDVRLVQFTPPGSGCSVQFGTGLTSATPGSGPMPYLVVSDIEEVRNDLLGRGVMVGEVFHEGQLGGRFRDVARLPGLSPDRGSYGSFVLFRDTENNEWLIQEVTTRLPDRVDPAPITYASAGDLADALGRAEKAHGEHEKQIGHADPEWPSWYAEYMAAERTGSELPT